ncbi:MAG: hypothetical protein K2H40_04205, partial [Lachnospiraceae bacterium]|nr:hypothetical protein [Lachnospiraceae bacterium]
EAESTEDMAGGVDTADAGSVGAAASTNEAAAGAAADMTAASEEQAPEASSEATVKNEQIQETDGAETSRKEEEKAVWNDLEDGQILDKTVIRIQKAETADGGLFYQAAVEQADTDNILKSGTQIVLMCDEDTAYDFLRGPRDEKELKEQEIYLVTLCYDAEGGRFVVLTAEIWEEAKMES